MIGAGEIYGVNFADSMILVSGYRAPASFCWAVSAAFREE